MTKSLEANLLLSSPVEHISINTNGSSGKSKNGHSIEVRVNGKADKHSYDGIHSQRQIGTYELDVFARTRLSNKTLPELPVSELTTEQIAQQIVLVAANTSPKVGAFTMLTPSASYYKDFYIPDLQSRITRHRLRLSVFSAVGSCQLNDELIVNLWERYWANRNDVVPQQNVQSVAENREKAFRLQLRKKFKKYDPNRLDSRLAKWKSRFLDRYPRSEVDRIFGQDLRVGLNFQHHIRVNRQDPLDKSLSQLIQEERAAIIKLRAEIHRIETGEDFEEVGDFSDLLLLQLPDEVLSHI